jgi:hypothetical protein
MDSRKLITALAIVALLAMVVMMACATNPTPSPTPIAQSQTMKGNNTTLSSVAGFNITYPTSLKIDTSANASEPGAYSHLPPNSSVTSVLVATYPLASNTTLNAFVNYNKEQIFTQGYGNYTVISNQSVTFAGKLPYDIV